MKKYNFKSPAVYRPPFSGKLSIVALTQLSEFSSNEHKHTLEELHSCGFNLIKQEVPPLEIVKEKDSYTLNRPSTVDSILRYIGNNSQLANSLEVVLSLDVIVRNAIDSLYNIDIRQCIEQYQHSPYIYAWEIANSPVWNQWNSNDKVYENKNNINCIEDAYRLMVDADTDHLIFTTLPFPGLDKGCGGGAKQYYPDNMSYEEYFDAFDSQLPSSLLTYNPVIPKQSEITLNPGRIISYQEETYKTLKFFMQAGLKLDRDKTFHKVPFWICCTCENETYGNNSDDSSYSKMLWRAFNALAYGAQGLSFSDCLCRTSVSGNKNTAGISVRDGVSRVLREIKKVENIFAGCSVRKIVHALKTTVAETLTEIENQDSDTMADDNGYDYSDLPNFSTPIGPVINVRPDGIGVLVSHICSGNSDYVVFVNHSFKKEQQITVEFQNDGFWTYWVHFAKDNQDVKISEVVNTTGTTTESFYLAPGGCWILKFTDISYKTILPEL